MASQEDYLDKLLQSLTEDQDSDVQIEPVEEVGLDDIDTLLQSVIDAHEADTDFSDVPAFEDAPAKEEPVDVTAVEEESLEELPLEEQPSEEQLLEELPLEEQPSEELPLEELPSEELPLEELPLEELPETGVATEEDAAEMTEEEIVRLLAESQSEEPLETASVEEMADLSEDDLLAGMLNETDDADLREIQELLQKADNNEEIEGEPEDALPASEETSKAEQQKLQREAKKEAKRAAKEARRAEKEAKKVRKAASKKKKQESVIDGIESFIPVDDGLTEEEAIFLGEELSDNQGVQAETQELTPEDALMKELEGFDFLNDISLGDEENQEDTDSASADSLAQIMEAEGKETPKKGLFARFLDFISEEEEEEPENEEIKLSDENQNILKDMDKEKKNKKGKKAKKKKGAKTDGENGGEDENDDNETDNKENDKKGKKAKKAKKEKKPKTPRQPGEEAVPVSGSGKRIPVKHIVLVAVVCASIGAAIVLFVQIVGDYSTKQAGKKAYYEGDYQTCYQNLFGKDMDETEQVMYSKSESILTIRIWLREYELLAEEGQEVKALDSLLQSVYDYPTLYAYSVAWNAEKEVSEIYNQMLTILSEKYHLTEAQAQEIANTASDIEYTRMVIAIAQGEAYGSWSQVEEPEEEPEVLLNQLPEETELQNANFIDNR